MTKDLRINEWFVPKFGPLKFKLFIGLLFLPYTGMCISFVVLGALLSPNLNFERLLSICLIYFMSLGIAAHVADSIGSKKIKPWGNLFSKNQSWALIISSLVISYSLGLYYIVYFTPLLLVVGILESFFLFVYNFELFNGFFHNDFWFSFSWGMLPFFAGFIIQTNYLNLNSILVSIIPFLISYIEIKISRPYKVYKRNNKNLDKVKMYERILKILSVGTILTTLLIFFLKILMI